MKKNKKPVKTYPTIGACGLDCGLCPRYYTIGTSRCPGCCGPNFFTKAKILKEILNKTALKEGIKLK